jgi:hypothetical protein
MKNMLDLVGNKSAHLSNVANLTDAVTANLEGRRTLLGAESVGRSISTESFEDTSGDVGTAVTVLMTALKSANAAAYSGAELRTLTCSQEAAAAYAGIAAMSLKTLGTTVPFQTSSQDVGTVIVESDMVGSSFKRANLEAYDESRASKSTMAFSVSYNAECALQHATGSTFFPTVVIAPNSVGYTVGYDLLVSYNDISRQTSGALDDFKRQNVIRAIIDANILAVDSTKLIPVYRAGNSEGNFVAQTLLAAVPKTLTTGEVIQTSHYAVGKAFSILGICQTDAQVAKGLADQTDAVDPAIRLTQVDVTLTSGGTTEIFTFDISYFPGTEFNAAPQGNTQLSAMSVQLDDLLFTKDTKTSQGTASTILTALGTSTVRLSSNLVGSLVRDVGTTKVDHISTAVRLVADSTGAAVDTSAGAGQTIANLFSAAKVVGYDLNAFKTNSNRRTNGKKFDVQKLNYLYTVPLLPPLSVIRPVFDTDANDSNLLSKLVGLTRTQAENGAITTILKAKEVLSKFANTTASNAEVILSQPKLFGVAAAALITPAYREDNLDANTFVSALSTENQVANLSAALINKIRDQATTLFIQSAFGPACDQVYDGQAPKPLVIATMDPQIYRYLVINGETRLVGDMFDYKFVMSFDDRMVGKIILSLGHEQALTSGQPDPLHFGTFAYRPEQTIMMPMIRQGAQSMELTVQPSYRHIVNLPIMGVINVTNISTFLGSKVVLTNKPV